MSDKGLTPKQVVIGAICIAIVGIVIGYKFNFNDSDKDLVNLISSTVGVSKVIPWTERAKTSVRITTDKSKQPLADSVIDSLPEILINE